MEEAAKGTTNMHACTVYAARQNKSNQRGSKPNVTAKRPAEGETKGWQNGRASSAAQLLVDNNPALISWDFDSG